MKLSIIVPIFNEEKTIAFALESILYQKVHFEYEIIVYDDCSTDKSAEIIKNYQKSFPVIQYFCNKENLGNAKTFYKAMQIAKGQYFHVLDGDDFFTHWHKLQIQVDFLDNNPDYCAVAHDCLRLKQNHISNIEDLKFEGDKTYNYTYDNSNLFRFYHHTSTFMFKNILKHNLYKVLEQDYCRGDVIRFQLIQSITNEKIKYLNLFGSIYNFHLNGIWSRLSLKEQNKLSLKLLKARQKNIFNGIESEVIENQIQDLELQTQPKNNVTQKEEFSNIEQILNIIYKVTSDIVFAKTSLKEYIFQNCNYSSSIDEILESIGRIFLFKNNLHLAHKQYKKDTFAFIICGFDKDTGGGIIKEIIDLLELFTKHNKKIYIYSTEHVKTSDDIIHKYFNTENITFIKTQGSLKTEKIEFLIKEIYALSPERLYPYISHNDVVGAASIQKHLAQEIIVSWVYDHGTSLGISNSSITHYIAKNDSYYYTLKTLNKYSNVLIIPPVISQQYKKNQYLPLTNDKKIVTASAAARSYKLETLYKYQYCEVIPHIMQKTNGPHYHHGPLSLEYKNKIYKKLNELGIDEKNFIHIEWSNNLSKSLIDSKVDLFISSFPVGSIRIAIEVNAAGIPILGHHSLNRLFSVKHFLSPDNFFWESLEEIDTILSAIDSKNLQNASEKVFNYYKDNNSYEATENLLLSNSSKTYNPEKVLYKSLINLTLTPYLNKYLSIHKKSKLNKLNVSFKSIKYQILLFCYQKIKKLQLINLDYKIKKMEYKLMNIKIKYEN